MSRSTRTKRDGGVIDIKALTSIHRGHCKKGHLSSVPIRQVLFHSIVIKDIRIEDVIVEQGKFAMGVIGYRDAVSRLGFEATRSSVEIFGDKS